MSTDLKVGSHVQISVSVDLDRTFDVDHRPYRARGNGAVGVIVEVSAGSGHGWCYRVGDAWYAKEELTIIDRGQVELDQPNPPRIVCTKCPAVAKVHFWQTSDSGQSSTIWASCHGEHRWVGYVGRSGDDLIFSKLNAYTEQAISNDVEAACRRRGGESRLLVAQIQFLNSSGHPLAPERFSSMRGDIERILEFWTTILTITEGTIGSKS